MSIETPWQPKSANGPSLHHSRSTWLTYETFYGLTEKPFSLASDPAFFYRSGSHAKAFEDLQSGIRRRESLSVVSGDIGTGKTTLCRAVLQKLDQKTFSAFVSDPFVSREDLLKVVLMDFGVTSADDLTSGRLKGASRTELSYLLYEFLGTLAPLQAFAVVFIDEAQNLSVPLLEEIRILSDSDGRQRQLQVVLVGQLELRDKLRLPEMRQVDQRISVRCSLGPLDLAGVAGYVAHRLDVAGGSIDRVSFSDDAIEAVYETSGGVPRLINRICDRALHHGHLRQAAIIDRGIVKAALPDMEIAPPADVESAPPADVEFASPAEVESAPPARDVPPARATATAATPARATAATPATTTAAAPAAATPLTFDEFEPVDEWFAAVDRSVNISDELGADAWPDIEEAAPPPRVHPPKATRMPSSGSPTVASPTMTSPALSPGHRVRIRTVPLTHMESLTRTWTRVAQVAVFTAVILGGAGLGLDVAWNALSEPEAPVGLPTLPAQPRRAAAVKATGLSAEALASAPVTYSIYLPALDTLAGARGLDLLDLDPAVHQPVAIGSYATRAEAESQLARLHQVRGYEAAVAVETHDTPRAR